MKGLYRRGRVRLKTLLGREPRVPITLKLPMEYHGSIDAGWAIPRSVLTKKSCVVDVGLGENITFSQSIAATYGCEVAGFDPTPKAVRFVRQINPENFVLHEYGLAAESGRFNLHLPDEEKHVSGTLRQMNHTSRESVELEFISLQKLFEVLDVERIDLLKLDIEGAEYGVIQHPDFAKFSHRISVICVEFHHRWQDYGVAATVDSVRKLTELGFYCCWKNIESNEEFTFYRSA